MTQQQDNTVGTVGICQRSSTRRDQTSLRQYWHLSKLIWLFQSVTEISDEMPRQDICDVAVGACAAFLAPAVLNYHSGLVTARQCQTHGRTERMRRGLCGVAGSRDGGHHQFQSWTSYAGGVVYNWLADLRQVGWPIVQAHWSLRFRVTQQGHPAFPDIESRRQFLLDSEGQWNEPGSLRDWHSGVSIHSSARRIVNVRGCRRFNARFIVKQLDNCKKTLPR